MTPRVQVRGFEFLERPLTTRLPFRYGIVTLTSLPHLIIRSEVEVDGRMQHGWAADGLVPKWFTKDPQRAMDDEFAEMRQVIRSACARAIAAGRCRSAFELWQNIKAGHDQTLLENFGVSFAERAVIDAICRSNGRPFANVLRDGALGVAADFLPPTPSESIIVRHTVGLADALTEQRVDDGLPDSLEAAIAAYGLTHFKIKLGGDVEADLDRLRQIARLFERVIGSHFAFTLDGNENYRAVEPLRELWERMHREEPLQRFLERLLFIEQPFRRDVALSPDVAREFSHWPERPPMIIDESDASTHALPLALDVGYVGTSHKNCKGIFKGLANAQLIAEHSRTSPRPLILSGEDLSTIGPVSLLQDLAVLATLGVSHAERNGHHYFRGLSAFPPELQERLTRSHDDLYRMHERGFATPIIRDGRMSTRSVAHAPFGLAFDPDELESAR